MKKLILLFTCLVLLAFTTGDSKSEYYLPPLAYSVYADDIDLDGDNDIVAGHKFQNNWGGVSITENDGNGYFLPFDTMYFDYGYPFININKFDQNDFPDIVGIHITNDPYTVYAGIIYNYGETQFDSVKSFFVNYDQIVEKISSGDFNGDGYNDIVFAKQSPDGLWGVLYNDGNGNFPEPVYYNNLNFPPMDVAVGDINGDSIDDILFGGYHLEIHYGTPTGFDYQFLDFYRGYVELFDLDFDGDLDIATIFAFGQSIIFLYENTGNNNFVLYQQQTLQGTSGGFEVADFNKDSIGDLIIIKQQELLLFYNKGDFILNDPETIPLSFIHYGTHITKDLDNNQYSDLIFLQYSGNPALRILFNDGNGNFVEDPVTTIINLSKEEHINFNVFPNPVHSQATILFSIKKTAQINLTLFDISGKPVNQILQDIPFPAGRHSIPFKTGNKLPKGIYFIKMDIDKKHTETIKIIIN